MKRLLLVSALGIAALALTAPAQAQSSVGWLEKYRPGYSDAPQTYYDARRAAYENGFREGLKEGEKDGRKRDPYRWDDEKGWQKADKGYRREYGDRERYRQAFRTGYADGYAQSYRRYAPAYGNGRWDDRGGYGTPRPVPRRDTRAGYPGQPYPGQYPGQYGRYGVTGRAYDVGAEDGFEKGQEDARKNRSFDPLRHEKYRSADREYDRDYGSKEAYKDVYRQGFRVGYEEGYRGRYYR